MMLERQVAGTVELGDIRRNWHWHTHRFRDSDAGSDFGNSHHLGERIRSVVGDHLERADAN
jgi:hypothetical protein